MSPGRRTASRSSRAKVETPESMIATMTVASLSLRRRASAVRLVRVAPEDTRVTSMDPRSAASIAPSKGRFPIFVISSGDSRS